MKTGDLVLVNEGNGSKAITKISRETKTQLVVELKGFFAKSGKCEVKFSKSNRGEIGGNKWHRGYIEPITEDEANVLRAEWKIKRRKKEVIFQISKLRAESIKTEDLEKFEAILISTLEMNND